MKILSFAERAALCSNPAAKNLFQLMHEKKTNLCVSADLIHAKDLLRLIEAVGSEICLLKTHIDILEDFTPSLILSLEAMAKKYRFMIFEDRKFADIGNTVLHQYRDGIYHIVDWAHITNAHPLPGEGIIEGLKKPGLEKDRGLLLLAQMSSANNFIDDEYTARTVALAKKHSDFVIGFISQEKLTDDPRFIHMTPGIQLEHDSDALGQQYNSPRYAIQEKGTDIIIVGRGIYASENPTLAAKKYREQGWQIKGL